jgi:hypothetical protein
MVWWQVVLSYSAHIEQTLRPWSMYHPNASHKLNHKNRPKLKVVWMSKGNQLSAHDTTSSLGNIVGIHTLARFALLIPRFPISVWFGKCNVIISGGTVSHKIVFILIQNFWSNELDMLAIIPLKIFLLRIVPTFKLDTSWRSVVKYI